MDELLRVGRSNYLGSCSSLASRLGLSGSFLCKVCMFIHHACIAYIVSLIVSLCELIPLNGWDTPRTSEWLRSLEG